MSIFEMGTITVSPNEVFADSQLVYAEEEPPIGPHETFRRQISNPNPELIRHVTGHGRDKTKPSVYLPTCDWNVKCFYSIIKNTYLCADCVQVFKDKKEFILHLLPPAVREDVDISNVVF